MTPKVVAMVSRRYEPRRRAAEVDSAARVATRVLARGMRQRRLG
jgi:hypothetical protein